jgi:hypothetical protein
MVRFKNCLFHMPPSFIRIEPGAKALAYPYADLAALAGPRGGRFRFHWRITTGKNISKIEDIKSSTFRISEP